MDEDRLISSPPMDIVIQKRQSALRDLAEQKRREKELKPTRVKDSYNDLLESFANKYFKGRTQYVELSPQEQKALAKICFRQSLKTALITSLSLGTIPAILVSMGGTIGAMVGLGFIGLIFSGMFVFMAEVVLETTNSFQIYEGFQFIRNHLFLKRKKLL